MQVEIDQNAVQNAVIERLVTMLGTDVEHILIDVNAQIQKRIDEVLSEKVDDVIAEAVDSFIKEGFNREYQKVNPFGEPVGAKTTISKELERLVSTYWNDYVDKDGKPTKSSYRGMTRAEYVMTRICANDFSKSVKEAAASVTGEFKDGLRAALNSKVDDVLADCIRVKSPDERRPKGRKKGDPEDA